MSTLSKLYNIQETHWRLLQAIEEGEGEITPEIERGLTFTEDSLSETAVSIAYVLRKLEHETKAIEEEIARLQALKKSAVRKTEFFKKALSGAMQQFGIQRIDTDCMKLFFRKSTAVEIENEKAIPWSFYRPEYLLQKAEIKKALQEGQEVPGARLVERQNLQVK